MNASQHSNNTPGDTNMTRQARPTITCFSRSARPTLRIEKIASIAVIPPAPQSDDLFSVPQGDSIDSVLSDLVNVVIG